MVMSNSQKITLGKIADFINALKEDYPGVYNGLVKNQKKASGDDYEKIAEDAEKLAEQKIPLRHLSQKQKSDLRELFPKVVGDVFTAEELADHELAQRMGPEEMIDFVEEFETHEDLKHELGFDPRTGEEVNGEAAGAVA